MENAGRMIPPGRTPTDSGNIWNDGSGGCLIVGERSYSPLELDHLLHLGRPQAADGPGAQHTFGDSLEGGGFRMFERDAPTVANTPRDDASAARHSDTQPPRTFF